MRFPEDVGSLPEKPGVYIYYDGDERILYVGKAKNLRKRVRSYLRPGGVEERKRLMVESIRRMEYLTTKSEYDALILETDLIKAHRPPYNVRLADDRGYCYIRFGPGDFPSIRRVYRRDGKGTFMGPYLDSRGALTAVRLVREIWGLRDCERYRKGGCLNRDIGLCTAPCQGRVSKYEYAEGVARAKVFLRGGWKDVVRELETRMETAAESENFEEAARLRDLVRTVRRFLSRRTILTTGPGDEDVISLKGEGGNTIVSVLAVRDSRVVHSGRVLMGGDVSPGTAARFLLLYYADVPVPKRILIDTAVADENEVVRYLSERRGKSVSLLRPKRGRGKALLDLAKRNARLYLVMEAEGGGVAALKRELGLPKTPRRIEGYDVSHLGGEYVSASMVVFTDGKSDRTRYRWFRVKGAGKGDHDRMREVLQRRAERLGGEGWETPDLVVVDGGPAQLAAATEAFSGKGVPVISLAKGNDGVYLPGLSEPVTLAHGGAAILLLKAVMNEAHRFANAYRRRLQADRMSASALDGIAGVGPVLKTRLLRRFGSVHGVAAARVEDIASVKGVGKGLAERIKEELGDLQSNGGSV